MSAMRRISGIAVAASCVLWTAALIQTIWAAYTDIVDWGMPIAPQVEQTLIVAAGLGLSILAWLWLFRSGKLIAALSVSCVLILPPAIFMLITWTASEY